MATLINRGLSGLVYCAYVAAALTHAGGGAAVKLAIGLLLPLACIWFPEPLGEYAGAIHGQLITSSTPAFLVSAGGWLLLIGVPIIVYALSPAT